MNLNRMRYYRFVRLQGWNREPARMLATSYNDHEIFVRLRLFELAAKVKR